MVYNATFGIDAARSWTRVNAFIVDASPILGTIAVHDALGTAFNIWIAVIFGQTGARAGAVSFFANGIGSTWRRLTRRWWRIVY